MDRGRKRPEVADQLPADKRACSSSEFRPAIADAVAAISSSSTSSIPPPSSSDHPDCDMESSSSGRGGGDSAYGSCESDEDPHHHQVRAGCCASRGKFQRIISVLDSEDANPSAQLASLTELCEALSFCMEDSLGSFPMDNALPLLVRLARSEGNPDIMLLAIRSITYLCDVMPRSADAIVRHGALPVLCGRLLSIEYLDVAEQVSIGRFSVRKTTRLDLIKTCFVLVIVLGHVCVVLASIREDISEATGALFTSRDNNGRLGIHGLFLHKRPGSFFI